jgi:type IV secretory pathway VirB10-like protein
MLKPAVTYMIILAFSLLVCAYVTQASFNNNNSTPEDTIIIEQPKEPPHAQVTPSKPPVNTQIKETPGTITVTQPTTPPEDEYQKAKERQQQEQIDELNKQEQAEETTEEQVSEPQPINVNSVVDPDGYVYVGTEYAGRQVVVTGV